MNGLALPRSLPSLSDRTATWLYKRLPIWPVLIFCIVVAIAYSPNVVNVFCLIDDYDVLVLKRTFFFFNPEMEHLFSIARPIAALFTNLFLLPVESLPDLRWVRIISVLTVCVLGTQLMAICVVRLQTTVFNALVIALAVFLGLAFIYAAIDATAWMPHLGSTLLATIAYTILSRSNILLFPLLGVVAQRDWRELRQRSLDYSFSGRVWIAILVEQVAFYDYPAFPLLLCAFPVIGILFSRMPRAQRTLLAARDICFVGASLALYALSTKLIYLPFVRLFTSMGSGDPKAYESEFVASIYAAHQFMYNTDVTEMLRRLEHMAVVSGDLWFPPQGRIHLVTSSVLALAIVLALVTPFLMRRKLVRALADGELDIGRLRINSWTSEGAVTFVVLVICFVMAAAPIWASQGGLLAYRTVVGPATLVAIVFLFSVQSISGAVWNAIGIGLSAIKVENAAGVMVICAAFAGNFYSNYAVMTIGRNEFAYFTDIVRHAIDNKSKTITLIDPRPVIGVTPAIADQQGRPLPPFELGCVGSNCIQTGGVVHEAAKKLGLPYGTFALLIVRDNEPIPNLTCEMLTQANPSYPPGATAHSIEMIDQYRAKGPITCVVMSMVWHDLGFSPRR